MGHTKLEAIRMLERYIAREVFGVIHATPDKKRSTGHRQQPLDTQKGVQGSQFTSFAWTDRRKRVGIRISIDGKGRCLDNERLWRSLKYECVYLHAWETGSQAKVGIGSWITFYNLQRPHTAHRGQPPAVVYFHHIETDQQVQAAV